MTEREAVIVVAGGTGGHVFPALAVARELDERGFLPVWMGTRTGLEARIVPAAGIEIEWIDISGVRGKNLIAKFLAPAKILYAIGQAIAVLRRRKPLFMIGMGGFVAGPGGIAAWLMRCPLFIHEQNAVAGLTNRVLSRFAKRIMAAFPGSFGSGASTLVTGNPLRPEFAGIEPPGDRKYDSDGVVRILVVGGSQGARTLNEIVPRALGELENVAAFRVRHQCGNSHRESTRQAYSLTAVNVAVVPFMDRMADELVHADMVICRAGAMTVAEISAVGVPAIFIPFPSAVDDHQTRNAEYLVQAGAARLLPEKELNAKRLASEISDLAGNPDLRLQMAEAARAVGRPDATKLVVDECMRVMGRLSP